jgi:CheY-like chemotaxis protein
VEDDEVNRLLMAAFFQTRFDTELFIAVDGRTGIKMAREVMPDIFLIDMMLPDIGGADVLAAIREFEHCANTPCIAVSANAQPAEIEFAMNAGFDSYLTKPLTLSRLMREVDRFGVVEHPR